MKLVDSKTGGEKSTVVAGDIVTMQHTTYHKASDSHYGLTTTFDFADVDRDSIVKLAAECLLIRWRTAFKNAEKVSDADDNQRVKVAEMLAKGRRKLTLAQKVQKLGASREELLALLAETEE